MPGVSLGWANTVDSVPAVLAVTDDVFIAFTSNGLALLGLRALFFVLAGAVQWFRYLKVGLAGVLVFVGAKMTLSGVFKLPPALSLAVVGISTAATWFLRTVSTRVQRRFRDKVTIALESLGSSSKGFP